MLIAYIYLDFAKAFVKLDIGILSHKIKKMGFSGNLGVFLYDFLSGRDQAILANGVKSKLSQVRSGVPQETVLGPILFLIMINDIYMNIESDISLFSDDTRVTKPVKEENDAEELQMDLGNLYLRQEENNILFNGTKFEILRYGQIKTYSMVQCTSHQE